MRGRCSTSDAADAMKPRGARGTGAVGGERDEWRTVRSMFGAAEGRTGGREGGPEDGVDEAARRSSGLEGRGLEEWVVSRGLYRSTLCIRDSARSELREEQLAGVDASWAVP